MSESETPKLGLSLWMSIFDVLVWGWMLGVMLLSWLLFGGPGLGSLAKRVAWLGALRDAIADFFGSGA
jgi:hypothetical protein